MLPAAAALLAYCTPNVEKWVSLNGGTFGIVHCWILPMICTSIFFDDLTKSQRYSLFLFINLSLVFAISNIFIFIYW